LREEFTSIWKRWKEIIESSLIYDVLGEYGKDKKSIAIDGDEVEELWLR